MGPTLTRECFVERIQRDAREGSEVFNNALAADFSIQLVKISIETVKHGEVKSGWDCHIEWL